MLALSPLPLPSVSGSSLIGTLLIAAIRDACDDQAYKTDLGEMIRVSRHACAGCLCRCASQMCQIDHHPSFVTAYPFSLRFSSLHTNSPSCSHAFIEAYRVRWRGIV
ncbi:hypothetical protein M430DRAFT_168520 [Amorphotheca resinae ATCC 22711]|uniref:Uncharacterized protein n=1 Tax=Amorphotheca resinae ATCC 22711 TaxID=857342 RepID=A0A2T3AUB5_AMORE|nr:hypothetical protein M430DRAFT_168520 [Amorphotheca resinae ATCC 22711]PSS12244.1 hypothetical protein M430DRAFT_168520 [Amorphotheca resinae ATCC 22711]